MEHSYWLPPELPAIPVAMLRTAPAPGRLRLSDPAERAMSDFRSVPPFTVTEDLAFEQVVDGMFRLGVRAMLVVRDHVMIGLLTIEDARERLRGLRGGPMQTLRVTDVMTHAAEVPAVDWQMIQDAQVRDVLDILEGSGARQLVVLQSELSARRSSVRGLILRERLDRQLGSHRLASPSAG